MYFRPEAEVRELAADGRLPGNTGRERNASRDQQS
jgi:hypothetical protein